MNLTVIPNGKVYPLVYSQIENKPELYCSKKKCCKKFKKGKRCKKCPGNLKLA